MSEPLVGLGLKRGGNGPWVETASTSARPENGRRAVSFKTQRGDTLDHTWLPAQARGFPVAPLVPSVPHCSSLSIGLCIGLGRRRRRPGKLPTRTQDPGGRSVLTAAEEGDGKGCRPRAGRPDCGRQRSERSPPCRPARLPSSPVPLPLHPGWKGSLTPARNDGAVTSRGPGSQTRPQSLEHSSVGESKREGERRAGRPQTWMPRFQAKVRPVSKHALL